MDNHFPEIVNAILMSAGMLWDVGWSLALGFLISALLQVFVSKEKMSALLGHDGPKELALSAGFGAASSSCSYAATSIARTLFQKGASFTNSLAFMFASTNLVVELGLILYVLMGWQFMAAEWIGGVVLIIIMSLLVRLTYPRRWIDAARPQAEAPPHEHMHHDHEHMHHDHAVPVTHSIFSRETHMAIAQSFMMDLSMLWKDLLIGFLIAGFLSTFIPNGLWQALFIKGANPTAQMLLNAAIGPLIAILTFVCSIGNVPMAAILWSSGISFGGVLSFLYADLIVLPLLDVYRRYYGWKLAAYIGGIFYVTMVLAGIVMDVAFTSLGLVPQSNLNIRAEVMHFDFNYTFWLNLVFGAVAVYLMWLASQKPMKRTDCCH